MCNNCSSNERRINHENKAKGELSTWTTEAPPRYLHWFYWYLLIHNITTFTLFKFIPINVTMPCKIVLRNYSYKKFCTFEIGSELLLKQVCNSNDMLWKRNRVLLEKGKDEWQLVPSRFVMYIHFLQYLCQLCYVEIKRVDAILLEKTRLGKACLSPSRYLQ